MQSINEKQLSNINGGFSKSEKCKLTMTFSGIAALGDPVVGISSGVYSYLNYCR
jgi:bacteriocin-like protein